MGKKAQIKKFSEKLKKKLKNRKKLKNKNPISNNKVVVKTNNIKSINDSSTSVKLIPKNRHIYCPSSSSSCKSSSASINRINTMINNYNVNKK